MLVRARFDAAQTTPDNRKHWSNADALAADAAANPEVRRTLRIRVPPYRRSPLLVPQCHDGVQAAGAPGGVEAAD